MPTFTRSTGVATSPSSETSLPSESKASGARCRSLPTAWEVSCPALRSKPVAASSAWACWELRTTDPSPCLRRCAARIVRKIAALDTRHSPEELARVFGTFAGLYQMMPSAEKWGGIDLLDAAGWPKRGPRPRADLLELVADFSRQLAAPSERFVLIAGVNRETIVDCKSIPTADVVERRSA